MGKVIIKRSKTPKGIKEKREIRDFYYSLLTFDIRHHRNN